MTAGLSVHQQASLDSLMERLDDPQVAAALINLLDHADLLAILIVGLDGLVSRSETIGDALVDGIDELRGVAAASNEAMGTLELGEILASLMTLSSSLPKITPAVTRVVDSGLIEHVLDSGITDPAMVTEIARIGRGLTAGAGRATTDPIAVNGLFSAMKLLKDPDIQRAVSYFAAVAKSIGVELDKS
ncbi:DUF1641 domain-containing protein [Nocardioides pelophilus]|uniref:DUF1641 domain-containing protein n=1 Tax=Nocardioides pelophilus TaxID=2172019 RepID=UPI0016042551|nr:DUF1641 domain-containing protein [Nocardioides pelophilus]